MPATSPAEPCGTAGHRLGVFFAMPPRSHGRFMVLSFLQRVWQTDTWGRCDRGKAIWACASACPITNSKDSLGRLFRTTARVFKCDVALRQRCSNIVQAAVTASLWSRDSKLIGEERDCPGRERPGRQRWGPSCRGSRALSCAWQWHSYVRCTVRSWSSSHSSCGRSGRTCGSSRGTEPTGDRRIPGRPHGRCGGAVTGGRRWAR